MTPQTVSPSKLSTTMEAAFILLNQEDKDVGREGQTKKNFLHPVSVFNHSLNADSLPPPKPCLSLVAPSAKAGISVCFHECTQTDTQTYSSCVIWYKHHSKINQVLPVPARLFVHQKEHFSLRWLPLCIPTDIQTRYLLDRRD